MKIQKIDIEAKLFISILLLKEEKKKQVSISNDKKNIVYLFEDYDEFKHYFVVNGFDNISDEILELCRMKTTKKGTIIASKGLCDHAIRQNNLIHSSEKYLQAEKIKEQEGTKCLKKVRRKQ